MVNKHSKPPKKSVAFFPSVASMDQNPYWLSLAKSLEEDGVEFHYDTPNTFSKSWLDENQRSINVLHIHYCQKFYRSHGKANFTKLVIYILRLFYARVLGYQVVFTLHNLTPTFPLEPWWIDKLGHLVTVHLSHRIIVHCQRAKELLFKKYARCKSVYVVEHPNFDGIYPNLISKQEVRKQQGIEQNEIIFTYFGGIRPNKGIETLIDAFMTFKGFDYQLRIVGAPQDEIYAERLKERAKEDLRIFFHFKFVANEDVQFYINPSDIIVLPFTRILTSGSTILMMSFGKPVIVPRMGCLPELVDSSTGWLFESNNVESLTQKMREAVNSDFVLIGENARRRVECLTIKRFANETQSVYWEQ